MIQWIITKVGKLTLEVSAFGEATKSVLGQDYRGVAETR